MKKTLQTTLLLLGALAFLITLATAEGKCGNTTEAMKCKTGKCGNSTKMMKCKTGKCSTDKNITKKVPQKGKCGQGKCG